MIFGGSRAASNLIGLAAALEALCGVVCDLPGAHEVEKILHLLVLLEKQFVAQFVVLATNANYDEELPLFRRYGCPVRLVTELAKLRDVVRKALALLLFVAEYLGSTHPQRILGQENVLQELHAAHWVLMTVFRGLIVVIGRENGGIGLDVDGNQVL